MTDLTQSTRPHGAGRCRGRWWNARRSTLLLYCLFACSAAVIASASASAQQPYWSSSLDPASTAQLSFDLLVDHIARNQCTGAYIFDADHEFENIVFPLAAWTQDPASGMQAVALSETVRANACAVTRSRGIESESNMWILIKGLGTPVVEVLFWTRNVTDHRCMDCQEGDLFAFLCDCDIPFLPPHLELLDYWADGISRLVADLGFVIDGIPDTQQEDVHYAWSGFTFVQPKPEAVDEDAAEVRDVWLTIDAGTAGNPDPVWFHQKPANWFNLENLNNMWFILKPGAGLGSLSNTMGGDTVWVHGTFETDIMRMQPPPATFFNKRDDASAHAVFKVVLSLAGPIDGAGQGFSLCSFESPCATSATCPPSENDCFNPGGATTPGCDDVDCCNRVCRTCGFEYCCTDQWNILCAAMADQLCNAPDPQPVWTCDPANDCLQGSQVGTPGCDDTNCCHAVCNLIDSSCCTVEWSDACAMYATALCGAGGTISDEPEPCGQSLNNGCDDTPPAFTPITCGDSICGTVWADGGDRDTDWYEINHPGGLLEWTVYPEFDAIVRIISGTCPSVITEEEATATVGSLAVVSRDLPPGIYYLYVTPHPSVFNLPCDSGRNGYIARASCTPTPPPPPPECLTATNNCYIYGGPGCIDSDCCAAVCAADPFCCNVLWDGFCTGPIGIDPPSSAVERPECVGCGDPGNDCCTVGVGPYCENALCCVQTCNADPYCCETHWDDICADAAVASCAICLPRPPNDDCPGAESVTPTLADVPSWPFDNLGATTAAPTEPCGGFIGHVAGNTDSDVWFWFVAPCAQTYTFSVSPQGGGPTTFLAVYEGTCPQIGGTLVGCDTGSGAATDVKTVVGETYIVRAGSPPGQQGDFELSILRPCPPDLNNDGWVDGGDLLHLLSGWGTVTPLTVCMDFNHDGVVDGLDLLYMLSWWGQCP